MLDLCGDFGGLAEVVLVLSTFFFSSISEHAFTIKAIQKLYKAKTVDTHLFTQNSKRQKKMKENRQIIN